MTTAIVNTIVKIIVGTTLVVAGGKVLKSAKH